MILFINACARNASRTKRLADHLLEKLPTDEIREVRVYEEDFPRADQAFLDRRDALLQSGALEDPMFRYARQFAQADTVVVAAPYWDFSFPAALKQYFEQVNAVGVTFAYTEDGRPYTLCRAKELWYVTTAGGPGHPDTYGCGYVQALAEYFYGIPECHLIRAEGLDIFGADVESILREAEDSIDRILASRG